MDTAFVAGSADEVRGLIAFLYLNRNEEDSHLGGIRLSPHQTDAVGQLRYALSGFGGAFLCDAVGSGKTYTALAVASKERQPVVIAPAGLRAMWMASMRATGVHAQFVSTESLSRRIPDVGTGTIIVIDEAHHFRNRATKRHKALCALARARALLFVTATPIHNASADLATLAAIFLGANAQTLTDTDLAKLIVSRDKTHLAGSVHLPRVERTRWHQLSDDPGMVDELLALPPPAPFRESGEAASLVTHGLIRQWASSEAALISAINRRLAKATTLQLSLESGEYPSEKEMRSWLIGEDAIQLGFPGLFALPAFPESDELIDSVRAHATALAALLQKVRSHRSLDDERSTFLQSLANNHSGSPIIAFASYESTVGSMARRLSGSVRTALLTSREGRVVGGKVSRAEIIRQFDPHDAPIRAADRIDLLLTTDLLSEGVNLQRAGTVVHLDIPWTAARMDQRIGRIARMGSMHREVRVFGLLPPRSAERALRSATRIRSKWLAASLAVGVQQDHFPANSRLDLQPAPPEAQQAIRVTLGKWIRTGRQSPSNTPVVGCVRADTSGFLALLEKSGEGILLSNVDGIISASPATVSKAAVAASGGDAKVDKEKCSIALAQIQEWTDSSEAKDIAGLGDSSYLNARRAVLARINASAAGLAPHRRLANAELIERARSVTTSRHGWADEVVIKALGSVSSNDEEEWLERAAAFGKDAHSTDATSRRFELRALLLFSTPPPAS